MSTDQPSDQKANPNTLVMTAMTIGAMVAVGIGTYGAVHPPGTVAINVAGFSSFLAVKSWMATLALILAIVQVITALRIYGKIQRGNSRAAAFLHRWSGRAAVAASVPVAAHCLYIAGFMATDARVLLHSVAGAFFYGVFTMKMLVLSTDDSPGWALPVAGAAAFATLIVLWATSSLWFFTTFGVIF
jgi:hypothetical protein